MNGPTLTSSRIPMLATAIAWAIVAPWAVATPSASAELPSQDAYAGQALVLGSPHPHHAGGRTGTRNRSGSSGESGSSGGSGGSGESGSSGGGGSSGAGGGAGGPGSSGGAGGSGGTGAQSSGGTDGSSGAGHAGAAAGAGAAGALTRAGSGPRPGRPGTGEPEKTDRSVGAASASSPPSSLPSAGSVPLSGLDVLLLVMGVAALLVTAALLRNNRANA
jgi:hypothetical protein